MIRLMIVEDEPIIRKGIASADWASIGCEVVSTAANGVEALQSADYADIVITDIMMPEMDGLQLSEKLITLNPYTKIILLTGHKEFDFAQKALQVGAFDYVLKPIDPQGLIGTVQRAAEEMRLQIVQREGENALRKYVQESRPLLIDKLIQELLFTSDYSPDGIKRQMDYFGCEISRFVILCVEVDKLRAFEAIFSEEDLMILMFLVRDCLNAMLENRNMSAFTSFRGGRVYAIINAIHGDIAPIVGFAVELKDEIEHSRGFTVTIGLSRVHEGVECIRAARKETDLCMASKFTIGSNAVIYVGDISELNPEKKAASPNPNGFISAAANGANIVAEAETLAGNLRGLDEKKSRNCVIEATVGATRAYCENFGQMEELFEDVPLDTILAASNTDEIAAELLRIAEVIEQALVNKRNNRHHRAIQTAIELMRNRFSGDVTLKDAADSAFMSPAYFSRLFKKETGSNFSDYLAELRINKAKAILLQEPHLKNYQVAERVGISNAYYFNQLFKRYAGVTPGEYKR